MYEIFSLSGWGLVLVILVEIIYESWDGVINVTA